MGTINHATPNALAAICAPTPETAAGEKAKDNASPRTLDGIFKDAAIAAPANLGCSPFKEHRFVFSGVDGMIAFETPHPDPEQKLRRYRHEIFTGDHDPAPTKTAPEPIAYASHAPLKQKCAHFLQWVQDETKPRTNGREAMAVRDAPGVHIGS